MKFENVRFRYDDLSGKYAAMSIELDEVKEKNLSLSEALSQLKSHQVEVENEKKTAQQNLALLEDELQKMASSDDSSFSENSSYATSSSIDVNNLT